MSISKTNMAILLSAVLIITSLVVFSEDIVGDANGFEKEGFRYEIIPGTDEVKIYGTDNTPENFQIEPYVEHDGKTYKVTVVGACAFNSNHYPNNNFVLPDTVKILEERCFFLCSFDFVDLNNVSKLGSGCFDHSSANEIIIRESVNQIYEDSFVMSDVKKIVVENNTNFAVGAYGVLMSADGTMLYKAPTGQEIKDYVISDGVEIVCPYAFCGGNPGTDPILTVSGSLTISDTVKEIRAGAFCYTGIESLNISKENSRLKIIGYSAFSDCSNLRGDFIAPDSLEIMSPYAFNLVNFTSINTNNVRYVGAFAFGAGDSQPMELILGDKLETIDYSAFQYHKIKGNISIPKNVSFIGHHAFEKCLDIEENQSLTIEFLGDRPSMGFFCFDVVGARSGEYSVKIIAPWAEGKIGYIFDDYVMGNTVVENSDDCILIEEKWLSDGFCFDLYSNYTAKLVHNDNQTDPIINPVIPQSVTYEGFEYAVTKIGNGVFNGGMAIGTLTLPEGLECIQTNAFADCTGLVGKLTVPSTVEYLGFSCFTNTGFTELDIKTDGNNGLRLIDFAAFSGMSVENVTIPNTVVALGDGALSFNNDLKNVNLGNGVRYLAPGCFTDCPLLKNAVFGNSMEIISFNCFIDCSLECNLVFPESLYYVGYGAFNNVGDMNGKNIVFRGDQPFVECAFHLSTTVPTHITLVTNGWADEKAIEHIFGSMVEINNHKRGGNSEYLGYIIPIMVTLSLITALGITLYKKK